MNKHQRSYPLMDFGGEPLAINLATAASKNTAFRRALWTGDHLQLTVMSIPVGEEVGTEIHTDTDQLIRVEEGSALFRLGEDARHMHDERMLGTGCAILIPAGTYHNIVNAGRIPLKLSSVYAPPHHPFGTVHETRRDIK